MITAVDLQKTVANIIATPNPFEFSADFTYVVTNTGTTDLDNLSLEDDFVARNTKIVSAAVTGNTVTAGTGAANCTSFTPATFLTNAAPALLNPTCTLDPAGIVTVVVSATCATVEGEDPANPGTPVTDISDGDADANADNNGTGEEDPTEGNDSNPTPIPLPAINLVKSIADFEPNGDNFNVTYELTTQNTGSIDLNNLILTDTPNAELIAATIGVITQPNITVNSPSGDPATGTYPNLFTGGGLLQPGETVTVRFTLEIDPTAAPDPSMIENSATVSGEDPANPGAPAATDDSDSGTDPTTDNPDAPGNGGGDNPYDDPTPLIIADLGLSKMLGAVVAVPNSSLVDVSYQFIVQNTGTVDLQNLTLVDDFAAQFGAAYLSVTSGPTISAGTPAATTLPGAGTVPNLFDGASGRLDVGQQIIVDLTVRIDPAAATGNSLDNTATAGGVDVDNPGNTASDDSDDGTSPTGDNGEGGNDDPTSVPLNDDDGDGIFDIFESNGDRDGDGIPDNEDYDPSGYFYCETDGRILTGGGITVSGPAGDNSAIGNLNGINIIQDGSNGSYQFTVDAPGTYLIAPTYPPIGLPSTTRLDTAGPLDVSGNPNPFEIGAGSEIGATGVLSDFTAGGNPFYLSFDLGDVGDPIVIQNNIPMESCVLDNAILLSKQAGRDDVSIGEIVQYTVEAQNTQAFALNDIDFTDNIPGGFQYVAGSGLLVRAGADGVVDTADDIAVALEPTGGDPITFNDVDLAANETVLIRYFLRVTTGVVDGDYTNTVQGLGTTGQPVSNAANATVRVVQDPILQKTTIIGKVFADHDEDGWQDPAYANDVTIHSDHFGWNSHLIGNITGRTDDLDPVEEHQAVVRMPITDNNEFHISTAEGTLIKVMHDGEVLEEHNGDKEDGLTGQDLRVTTEVEGNEMVITIRNHGIQEQGIPGVRVATVEGLIVETDQYGRFHLADIDGGRWERGRNFIMKVDPHSLPEGSAFTTENPRVIRITQALMSKFNFGVKLPDQQFTNKKKYGATKRVVRKREVVETRTLTNVVDAIHFTSGKSEISSAYIEQLQAAIDQLSDKDNVRIEVIGHTDNERLSAATKAKYSDNYGLSKSRAEIVAKQLQLVLGLQEDAIKTTGRGPDEPVASNATRAGMAENRRVNVHVIYDEKTVKEVVDVDYEPVAKSSASRNGLLPNGGHVWVVEDPAQQDPRLDVLFHDTIVLEDGKVKGPVTFSMYSNYLEFIDHWELEIYRDNNVDIVDPVAVLEGTANRLTELHTWDASELSARDLQEEALWYVLKVYDGNGHFDKTTAKRLAIVSSQLTGAGLQEEVDHEALARSIYTRNSLVQQTIPLQGSRVRVNGVGIDPAYSLSINGIMVPISEKGEFVHEQHLPLGQHNMVVKVKDENGLDNDVEQDLQVDVDGKYMFMVGLANLTVGENDLGGSIEALGEDDHFDEDVWVDGRLAFYLKGKVKGKYLVTAQLDTTEAELNDLHDRIDDEDPTAIFRQLDPDKYYSVYGDDSTTIDDTDSQGMFYIRVDWDKSNALWGNYNTDLTGTEFGQYNRSLYGAKIEHRNTRITKFGDNKHELHLFASEAQTAAAHNSFNATGGSLYYLRDTQVVQGSEKIWVEIRSRDTEQVVENVTLEHGRDYDIDYLQGRIILSRPLTQVDLGFGPSIIKDAPLEGNDVYLLVDYEYRPDAFEADDLTAGARGKAWINDYIAIGGTYVNEEREGVDYELKGADVTLRAGKGTYIKFEYAESEAQQAANSFASANGGISFNNFNQQTLIGNTDTDGEAIGVEARVNLSEFTENEEGFVMAWYKDRDEGFSSVARLDDGIETTDIGLHAEWQASDRLLLTSKITNLDKDDQREELNASVQANYELTDKLSVGAELRYEDDDDLTVADLDGEAVLGGLELRYQLNEDTEVYTSGQSVISDSGDYESNAQATVGVNKQVSNKLAMKAEVTSGDRGDAVVLGGEYAITPNMNFSLNAGFGSGAASSVGTNYTTGNGLELYGSYSIDPDRTDAGGDMFTFGSRRHYQNGLTLYTESQFGEGEEEQSAARTFGLDFDLTDQWRLSASLQTNDLELDAGDIERRAATIGASFRGDRVKFGSVLEYREDDDQGSNSDNTQWVTSNTIEWQKSESLKLLGKLDLSATQSDANNNDEGKYVELDLGFAYRPNFNDRLNILGKYAFLYDLATTGQDTSDTDRRDHVFSLEGLYDFNNEWEFGAKFAWRHGDVRQQRGAGPWFETGARLAVLRARYHVIKNWDGLFEYRWLESETGDDDKQGALLGAYRHLGKNFKVGVGYNFTDFSDDLTDNDYDSDGWFFDIVGKY